MIPRSSNALSDPHLTDSFVTKVWVDGQAIDSCVQGYDVDRGFVTVYSEGSETIELHGEVMIVFGDITLDRKGIGAA